MLNLNERQKKTLKYLGIATGLYVVGLFYPILNELVFFTPLIFGFALYASNQKYLKYGSSLVIPFLFLFLFLIGTAPFFAFGFHVFDSKYAGMLFSCMSALGFVYLITKIWLKDIQFGVLQTVLIIILPCICILTLKVISYPNEFEIPKNFSLIVILYQTCMTVIIVSSMRSNNEQINEENEGIRAISTPNHS